MTQCVPTVTVQCKDTRIAVQVTTNKPFNGRIYALGRSETCNVDVISSDKFRLDLSLSGQDCNTQSIVSGPSPASMCRAVCTVSYLFGGCPYTTTRVPCKRPVLQLLWPANCANDLRR